MFEELRGSRVLVTGATGLIGSAICKALMAYDVQLVAFVRDLAKARRVLPKDAELIVGDITAPIVCQGSVDYIIHAASQTASRAFVDHPVEVINETLLGAHNILEFARAKHVKGIVFLSTMEIYGLTDSENVTETDYAALDSMSPRNCYPEAKRIVECLCASMAKEYGLPVKVARLTQTFGAGVQRGDRRVFAQFAEAAIEGRDIVLKSEGTTARCYCAIDDAVSAILTILVRGEPGLAYNVANPDTFCTIREMAELVAREFSDGKSRVVVDKGDGAACGYLPTFKMKLNVDRLKALGWAPKIGLRDMYAQLIADFREGR